MADSFSTLTTTGQSKSWLNRNVVGMALASFFSDMGHETATVVLPLFLASIGASPAALGIIEGVSDAIASFVKLAGGWYSDKIGQRKAIAVAGYALTGFSTGFFAFATQWWHILIARSIGWFGRGVRGPARDSILAESVPPQARGRAFGFHRAGDTLGAIAGPLFALLLVGSIGFQQIFLITFVPGLLSALAFYFFVTEKRRAPSTTSFLGSLNALPREFRLFLFGVGAFGAGNFAHSLLILRATQILMPTYGAVVAGSFAIGLYTIHNVLYAGASFPVGALADRIGKRKLLALGYFLFGLMSLGFMLPNPDFSLLAFLFIIAGIYIAMVDTLEGSMAADLLPDEVRGMGYGALATVNGVGDFVSSFVVSIAWTMFSPAIGFGYAAVMSIVGAVILFATR
ncbi:MAG: MFS transporter [Chloroflexi bacterium]|nr:MFS transporter [Chloroflexota bacterium]